MLLSKRSFLVFLLIALVTALAVIPASGVGAQDAVVLQVAVPEFMRNFLPDDTFAQFETDNPGVTVKVVYKSMDGASSSQDVAGYLTAVKDYVSSADVVTVQSQDLSIEATRAGYFLDLSPLTSADASLNVDDFVPALWQSFQWDGGVWALPISTDVVVVIYDTAAFDKAGLAYPSTSWTIDDFANAARKLTQYDAAGAVTTPGLMTLDNVPYLMRALLGQGFYAVGSLPDAPSFSNPTLENLLTTWSQLQTDGVLASGFSGDLNAVPLRIMGSFGLGGRGPRANDGTPPPAATLLPGNVAGLSAQGFAVSSGTLYPEQAYNLAKYLTNNIQIANNPFGVAPARKSLVGAQAQTGGGGANTTGPGGGGGPGFFRRNFTPETQAVIDQAIANGLPMSEVRYSSYVLDALSSMQSDGLDAHSALQQAEATAVSNLQTAAATKGTEAVLVATPVPDVVIQPGEIALNFGFASFVQPLPNQEQWDQLLRDFETNDPQVGKINMNTDFGRASDLATTSDCFYLPYNAVPSIDESTVLSLDPYLDADASFDRNDVVGTAMSLVQKDNKTWALPIIITPEVLRYNIDMFTQAGIPAPTNGWTVDQFTDALKALKPNASDPTPFVSRSPGGNYLLELIAAYGGIPLDRRTDPPTLNFTDPTTEAAIQQVLDLAKNGYINYQELARTSFTIAISGDAPPDPIYTESLNGFAIRRGGRRFGTGGAQNQDTATAYALTTYPSGSQYNAISYDIGTGYISATSQNADACYRWLSTIAQHPELFSAMPARRSFINDSAFAASQGADTVAVYNQFDKLMSASNTINFQTPFAGDANPGNFIVEFWLTRAFDNYVLKDADLNTELTDAQNFATSYQQCIVGIAPFDATTQDRQTYNQQFTKCAGLVDPTVANLFAGPGG
ncbi:MAG: hypothetical protein ABI690_25730 [Chloroflexota bacterium]